MSNIEKIKNKLMESFLRDLTKPEIDKIERAEIIKAFMLENQLNQADICRMFGFKKGTLSGWLKWGELGKRTYNRLKKEGCTETDITVMLKQENTTKEGRLLLMIRNLKRYIDTTGLKPDPEILEEVRLLRNTLNTMLYKNGD